MKEKDLIAATKQSIVEKSIQLLKSDGLKFSVDDLSAALKISKKTVYKYFSSKEKLAFNMFEKIFRDIACATEVILTKSVKGRAEISQMLGLYKSALYFSDDRIFNRYSLNDVVRTFANEEIALLYDKVEQLFTACGYISIVRRSCFHDVVTYTLQGLAQTPDGDSKIDDFVAILLGEAK